MTAKTILNAADILTTLKKRLQASQRDFNKYPNATAWNVQQRNAFMYQQAFYFFNSSSRAAESKHNLAVAVSNAPLGNWGDVICQYSLGMTLTKALNEYAVNP